MSWGLPLQRGAPLRGCGSPSRSGRRFRDVKLLALEARFGPRTRKSWVYRKDPGMPLQPVAIPTGPPGMEGEGLERLWGSREGAGANAPELRAVRGGAEASESEDSCGKDWLGGLWPDCRRQ